jgi:hypothetical protein
MPVASANTLWAKELGTGTQLAVSSAVAIDAAGDVIVGGYFQRPIDLGGGSLSNTGPFLVMLDPSGAYEWGKAFSGTGGIGGVTFVSADATGIVAAGWFRGTIDCGGAQFQNSGSTDEMFVVRLDPSGNHLWSSSFGDGTDTLTLGSMVLDGSGGLLLAGSYGTTATFGGATLAPAGTAKTADFVVELDAATGSEVWSVSEPATSGVMASVDGAGDVFLTGAYETSIAFGGTTLTSVGGYDIALAKLDPSGNLLWAKSFGSAGDDSVAALTVDSAGAVVLAAFPEGSISFGGSTLPGDTAALAKLDAGGNHVWSGSFGGTTILQDLVADGTDILTTGVASGVLTFGSGQLAASGGSTDLLVMKLDGSGNWIWGLRAGGSGGAAGHQIAVNAAHDTAVAGSTGAGSVAFSTGALSCGGGTCALVAKLGP